jgi:hypothetical protein
MCRVDFYFQIFISLFCAYLYKLNSLSLIYDTFIGNCPNCNKNWWKTVSKCGEIFFLKNRKFASYYSFSYFVDWKIHHI